MAKDLTLRAPRRAHWVRALLFLLPGLLGTAALAATFAWALWADDPPDVAISYYPEPQPFVIPEDTPFDGPPISRPPVVPASGAAVHDTEAVIGVAAGGHSRAYRVRAMSRGPGSHVINDVLGGVPVSVTYCDIGDCVRVFTADGAADPLDLSVGGIKGGGMVLKARGHSYRQESGAPLDSDGGAALPYGLYPAEETTWGEWRQAHPDTEVAVLPEPPKPPPAPRPPPLPHDGLAAALDLMPLTGVSALPLLIALGCFQADASLRNLRSRGGARRRPQV